MKKSFSLLELIFVILLLSITINIIIPKSTSSKIDEITIKLTQYLIQTRLQALIDDKHEIDNNLWHKKRWTLKFFRCRSSVGGLYYSIYSDKNFSGHPSAQDSLKDSLTGKNIYSSNFCMENEQNSKYVLLTKLYGVIDVNVSCNNTTSLGQLSFGSYGKVYSKLSNSENEESEYEIYKPCEIKLIDKYGEIRRIIVENETGYIR